MYTSSYDTKSQILTILDCSIRSEIQPRDDIYLSNRRKQNRGQIISTVHTNDWESITEFSRKNNALTHVQITADRTERRRRKTK